MNYLNLIKSCYSIYSCIIFSAKDNTWSQGRRLTVLHLGLLKIVLIKHPPYMLKIDEKARWFCRNPADQHCNKTNFNHFGLVKPLDGSRSTSALRDSLIPHASLPPHFSTGFHHQKLQFSAKYWHIQTSKSPWPAWGSSPGSIAAVYMVNKWILKRGDGFWSKCKVTLWSNRLIIVFFLL